MTSRASADGPEFARSSDVHGVERLRRMFQIELPDERTDEDIDGLLDRLLDRYEARIEGRDEFDRKLADLAHKINNPLTSLIGRSQLLKMNPNSDDRTRRAAEVIEESAARIADYVRELAALANR